MFLKNLIYVDYVNYKKPSMVLGFPKCSFKCGQLLCQNNALDTVPSVEINTETLVQRYLHSSMTSAIVCQGLEPLDSFDELIEFIELLREHIDDDIVIYTGYNKDEIQDKIEILQKYCNIIIKFGRYVPNQKPHYDKVLGVYLASDNQFAERIS